MNKITVYDCSIIELPKIENRSGNITPIHGNINVPFDINESFIHTTYQEVKLEGHMHIKNAINS